MSLPDLDAATRHLVDAGLVGPDEPLPEIFMVLGSGLGGMREELKESRSIYLSDLPGFPRPGVAGHSGTLSAGWLSGRRVLVQSGRYHFYEGYSETVVGAPMRLAIGLGVRGVVVTNAAGGIGRGLAPGSVMLLADHINLQWRNPLVGPVEPGEVRFPDMSAPYDLRLRSLAEEVAVEQGLSLHQGTYAAVLGPSYETPAEVEMLRRLGADAVGMSTVPEVLVARARGVPVLGISLITNYAAGRSEALLDHREVIEVGARSGRDFAPWIGEIVSRWPQSSGDTEAK